MKIEITFDDDSTSSAGWTVRHEDKYADCLAYEEMLGLVASLTMPWARRPCLQWLKTKEQHEEWQRALHDMPLVLTKTPIEEWIAAKKPSTRLRNILLGLTNWYPPGSNKVIKPFDYAEDVNEQEFMRQRNAGKKAWQEFVALNEEQIKLEG